MAFSFVQGDDDAGHLLHLLRRNIVAMQTWTMNALYNTNCQD